MDITIGHLEPLHEIGDNFLHEWTFWSLLSTKQSSVTKYSEVANNNSLIADSVSNTLEESTISAN
jgi:hypothetical protein